MDDWIADNDEDYVLKAISKASNLEQLFQTKRQLRERFLKSALTDSKKYSEHFGNALNTMWKMYLKKNITKIK